MAKPNLTIRIAQINATVGDIPANLTMIKRIIDQAKQEGIDLLVFPELALLGYPPQDLLQQNDCQNYWYKALQSLLEHAHQISILIGAPEYKQHQLFNAAYLLQDGCIAHTYHKQILPNYGVFDEKRYFHAGDGSNHCFELKGHRIGLMICEDLWHDKPSQILSKQPLDCIITINASPYNVNKWQERQTVCQKRSDMCFAPLIYANLAGGQDDLLFDGRSFALDNNQKLIFEAPAFESHLSDYQLEGHKLNHLKSSPPNNLTDCLGVLYKGLVTSIDDYITKNGFPGVIIGLSGGIDSALTLAVAVDALGADRVQAVMMPSLYTSQLSLDLAQQQVDQLKVPYTTLPIDAINASFTDTLQDWLSNEPNVTHENIQARIRGVLLMALSNQTGSIVLATGNKSEIAVGYATLYGDMAGGFAPLKDVSKTRVYQLANYRNQTSYCIPQGIIDRPPSAELAQDQQDSDSLPDYAILDDIIEQFIEKQHDIQTIIDTGHSPKLVQKTIRLILNSEHKRRQGPPGPKISQCAFERERRYPITSGLNRWLFDQK